MQSDDVLIIEI